jgi:8-oxo-dGTP pyrophosphatase MutT (NUDIX family)
MSFAERIRFCNSYEPSRAVPLLAGVERIGRVRRDHAALLSRFADVFAVEEDCVRLVASGDADAVTAAVDRVVDILVGEHRVPKWRNETFDVAAHWRAPPLFRLDRGAVPFFGCRAYGVHLNGYRRENGSLRLWIGRRAANKRIDPDKLDNLVAGGIGSGYGIEETLKKEGLEEAAIPPELTARAIPVGALSYRMETPEGIRDDVLFVYDLELAADFVPQNCDGELVEFTLMPIDAALDRIRATSDFKFNVNLVILDFALRHGVLRPSDPEYLVVASGLHRWLD